VSPSFSTRAGIAAFLLTAATALYMGTQHTAPGSSGTHVVLDWSDAGAPADARCMWLTGLASPQVSHVFGLDLPDGGGSQYVYGHFCASPLDGGTLSTPQGMTALEDTEVEEAYDGGPQLQAWTYQDPDSHFPCACSSGSACQVPDTSLHSDGHLVDAPLGVTLQPGWVGAGCLRKACIELGGVSSWRPECPLQ
jgi:hypothetical protein